MRKARQLGGLIVIILLTRTERPMAQRPETSADAQGSLIDVGGHKLYIRFGGAAEGRATVILEAGGGGSSSEGSRIQTILSPRVRTCAYDRAGSGSSGPGPAPRTMAQEVFELHLLLDAADVRAPYVLVGHSIGGFLVRLYVERYGGDIVGVVLVDPTHESEMLGSLRYRGWVRLREKARARAIPEPRREGGASTEYNPDDDYSAEEFQQLYLARPTNPTPLATRPLIVLAPGKPAAPPLTCA